jgi:hypothetical protein
VPSANTCGRSPHQRERHKNRRDPSSLRRHSLRSPPALPAIRSGKVNPVSRRTTRSLSSTAISPCDLPFLPVVVAASPEQIHGAGVKGGAAAGQGLRGGAVRGAPWVRVPAGARGEEQEVHRRPAHHRALPGALQAALLHPPRQVRSMSPPAPVPHPRISW